MVIGLAVLVYSADLFVDGAVGVARFCGMSTLLIGMVIVGFGTSAPEMVVSALSALQNNPELALGNAYGSNIANIALILGVTALIAPTPVQKNVIRKDIPILVLVTFLALILVWDGSVSRVDGFINLVVFFGLFGYNIYTELHQKNKNTVSCLEDEGVKENKKIGKSIFFLLLGLVFLVASSRALVWGAVEVARALGVSDLLIGLTVVAVGTSLPELASSIAAARKGEHDLALGNIIGSNMFNTLAVVGIAATISPMSKVEHMVLYRDIPVMGCITLLLFIFGINFRKQPLGRINRFEGGFFVFAYVCYVAVLIMQACGKL